MEKLEAACIAGGSTKWCNIFEKQSSIISGSKTELLWDPETHVLAIYARETNTFDHKKPCTQMTTATLFIVDRK